MAVIQDSDAATILLHTYFLVSTIAKNPVKAVRVKYKKLLPIPMTRASFRGKNYWRTAIPPFLAEIS